MTQPRPNLNRAWRRTFWQVYDNLGLLLAVNILWLLFSITLIGFPAATAALFYISYLIASEQPASLKDFFLFIKKKFFISIFATFLLFTIFLFLLFNVRFYLRHFGLIGVIFSGMSVWILIFSLLTSIYIFPFLCRYDNLWKIMKYSFILTIDNLKTALILFITALALLIIEIIAPILSMAVLAIFIQNAFLEIQSRYNQGIIINEPRRKFREIWKPWNFS